MTVFTAIGAAAFGAGTFMAGLTAAGLQLAAGVAVSLIGRAMKGEPEGSKFGVQGKLQAGEDVPRSINNGWNCTAGSLAWHGTFGPGGTMSARVIAIGDLPIREFLYPIVEGVDCTVLKGEAHANYGWPVAQFRKGGVDHLWVKFYDGTQTAADPFLVSTFGAGSERPYQASRIGTGVPYVIIFARAPERSDEGEKPLFQGVPSLKFVTNGVRWYNLALDSTAGGSGTHRWGNPVTWTTGQGDHNPIVQLYNLLRGVRFNGQWVYGMQALSAARLPAANWIAAINAAQAVIDGPDGQEPTYRAGGEVQVGAQVATTVEALITAANARLVESGGFYKIYVGPPGAPVMTFSDQDILSTEEQSFTPFLSLADTVNAIHASYPNPAEGWGTKRFTLLRPDLEPRAGNRRLPMPVSLDLVPYAGQVQRLTKWAMAEALRARRHTFVLGPEFRQLEAGDVVRWTSARNGYVDKLFRVDGILYKSNLDVVVDLTEVDPSDYDWNQGADFKPVVNGPLQMVGPKPMPMQGWQVFAVMVDGKWPSVEVRSASGIPGVERVRVQVRVGNETGQLIFDSDSQPYADPWRWVLQGQFPPSTALVVRGIFIGPAAAQWSGWLGVTTEKLSLGLDDLTDELKAELEEVQDFLDDRLPAINEELDAISGDLSALAGAPVFDYGTAYAVNDLVRYAGGIYRATVANTNALPTDASKWVKVGDYNSVTGAVVGFTARFETIETKVESTATSLVQTTRDTRRIQNALMAAAMLNAEQGQNQVLENTDQLAATATVSETVRTEVSRIDGTTTALAEQIEVVEAKVENDIAQAISAVTTQVQDVDGRVTAQATRVDELRAVIGNSAAEVIAKGEVVAAPAGFTARYVIRLQTTDDTGVVGSAMIFVDVRADNTSRIGFQANNTVFFLPDGTPIALFDELGNLRSANGRFMANMFTGAFKLTSS